MIERATILASGDLIEGEHLPAVADDSYQGGPISTVTLSPGMTVDEAETRLIRLTLEHTRDNEDEGGQDSRYQPEDAPQTS